MDIYVILWFVLLIAPICTILHEFGHVLGAKSMKADSITLSIGAGKSICGFSCNHIHNSIHTLFFLGGLAYSERNKPYKPAEIIWITLCGPVGNGVAATVFYGLFGFTNVFVQLFILFNIWLAIVNMIPFKLKEKQTDGYTIVKTAYTNFK
jgi:Zn-dependent protease